MNKFQAFQKEFFKQIESKVSSKKLVHVLVETLNISSDSAYRRIRNEKMLTLDEAIVLSKHFAIPLDQFTQDQTKTVIPFTFDFLDKEYDFTEYLKSILFNFSVIKQQNGTLYYSAKDIPIFYHMAHGYLGKFKVLYWLKTMLNQKDYQAVRFDDFHNFEKFKPLLAQVNKEYYSLNSVEIWNYETSHSVLSQVEYYYNLNFINKENALLVLEDYQSELKEIVRFSESGQKVPCGEEPIKGVENFKLFYNEVFAADNSILAKSDNFKAAFLPHINLNYMTTLDPSYCSYMEGVFDLVMQKSTLISGVNERDRNIFFNYNFERVNKLIEKIKNK